jgi:hypothetical protein
MWELHSISLYPREKYYRIDLLKNYAGIEGKNANTRTKLT